MLGNAEGAFESTRGPGEVIYHFAIANPKCMSRGPQCLLWPFLRAYRHKDGAYQRCVSNKGESCMSQLHNKHDGIATRSASPA